jgi:hypothetical protein
MAFHRENQRVEANEILQAIADGQEIKLSGCTVSGAFDVNRFLLDDEDFDKSKLAVTKEGDTSVITITESIVCDSCIFEENVCFAPPWEKPDTLKVIFKENVAFNSSTFKGQARFGISTFEGVGSFDGCIFKCIASFRSVTYKSRALYRTALFEGYGLFDGSTFLGEARFTNTCFSKGGNFTNNLFDGITDFSGVYSRSKAVPIYESVKFTRKIYGDDETFWRFIKQASQEAGYYQLAGEAFYNERCAHLCRRFHGPNFTDLSAIKKLGRYIVGLRLVPEMIFGRLLFGYGERPTRVLVASAMVVVICGLYYSYGGAQIVNRIGDLGGQAGFDRFMDGLYFSTTTFTTLGFGDMYPRPDHMPTRVVAMTEALSGACLMSLFVVSLAKRFSRG